MKYLLDTNTCIRFLNGRAPSIREKLLSLDEKEIVLSSITKAEMFLVPPKVSIPKSHGQNKIPFSAVLNHFHLMMIALMLMVNYGRAWKNVVHQSVQMIC